MPQSDTTTQTVYTLDIECYPNLFFVGLRNLTTQQTHIFSTSPSKPRHRSELIALLNDQNNLFKTFNGLGYDIPMLAAYLYCNPETGYPLTVSQLKEASDLLIVSEVKPYKFYETTGVPPIRLNNHIDLMEVAPGKGGLKTYAARIHSRKLQDLPYNPNSELTTEQKLAVVDYCLNSDLVATADLCNALKKPLELRQSMSIQYGADLRSKSDAQIAETVLTSELTKILHTKPKRPSRKSQEPFVMYDPPQYLRFFSPALQDALRTVETTQIPIASSGKLELPKAITDLDINIGGTQYQLGIGGLHSKEKNQKVVPVQDELLADFDVTSYYPSIILNNRLYPEHLTENFLTVYKTIVDRRIAAKRRVSEIRKEIERLEGLLNEI